MKTQATWLPDRRDVIWIDFNPKAGGEIGDVHPLLVLSPAAFNERTGLVIGLPMTHAERHADNPFAVIWRGTDNSSSYIVANQPNTFDWRARRAKPHPCQRAPARVFQEACEVLQQILALPA
ncbi:MAG: type II toxin-antitoxin system PemK/MazF family toxin [Betaproteobacteria bacterium]